MTASEPRPKAPSRGVLAWIERLTWLLIFGGLLALSLGVFLLRAGSESLGWPVVVTAGLAVLVGLVLVGVRARWP